jgi:exodeoxyribonuclease-5
MTTAHRVHQSGRVELTAEQQAALAQLLRFTKKEQSLGGFAGTGKSTLVAELIRRLPGFRVCAFTGKAANVLRRKGVEASTIHSLIYLPVDVEWVDDEGVTHRDVRWVKRDPEDFDGEGFIVDEASMVGRDLYDDLRSYGRPIIFVGDHGQLPPVQASGFFNAMIDPDIKLETIHRHAGEIPRFAEFVRQGNTPSDWRKHKGYSGTSVRFTPSAPLDVVCRTAGEPDQVICAFNQKRIDLNVAWRKLHGLPVDNLLPGERLICLQNDHERGIFNGQQGRIVSVDLLRERLVFRIDHEGRDVAVRFMAEAFHELRPPPRDPDGRIPFDYAYCVTCHKAQGDEWDHVLVFEQHSTLWQPERWAYTAATRARQQLTWVMP